MIKVRGKDVFGGGGTFVTKPCFCPEQRTCCTALTKRFPNVNK